jgi:hypothetical protein
VVIAMNEALHVHYIGVRVRVSRDTTKKAAARILSDVLDQVDSVSWGLESVEVTGQ